MSTRSYAINLIDGSSQYWTIADDASFDYATGNAFTFGLWFRRDYDDNENGTRSYLWSRENQHGMYLDSDGQLVYYFNGAGGAVTWSTGIIIPVEVKTLVVVTGVEDTDTTLRLYVNGILKGSYAVTGGMPADAATNLYFGIDYGTTAGYYFDGRMTGFFQSNTNALSAEDIRVIWNGGIYDIDITEAITGLTDSIGFEENTGTTYDNALNAGVDGAGTNTPTWRDGLDPITGTTLKLVASDAGFYLSGRFGISSIRVVDMTAADHGVLIQNLAKTEDIVEFEATADDFSDEHLFIPYKIVDGLYVSALDSGIVYVEIV